MRRIFQRFDQRGYILLPVVMALLLIALLVLVLNGTTGVNVTTVAAHTEILRARYVAEAGIAHGKWLLLNTCANTTLNGIPFQGHSYDVTIQNTSTCDYNIIATGILNTGTRYTIEANTICIPRVIYYSEQKNKNIWRANLDGANPSVVYFHNETKPIPIAIDSSNRSIYWAANKKIWRCNLDGTGATLLVDCGGDCDAYGLAVDPGNKIYWSNGGGHEIYRANVDGSAPEILFIINRPIGIALDLSAGKIYWTDKDDRYIKSGNLDGTGESLVIDLNPFGIDDPWALDIDTTGNKLFFFDQKTKTFYSVNLDGTNLQPLFNHDSNDVFDLAVDSQTGKIYWGDYTKDIFIQADLDFNPSSITTLSNTIQEMYGIDIGATDCP